MPAGWNPKPDACVRSSAAHLRVHERWLIPIMAVAVCAAGAQIVLDAEGGRVLLIKRGASRAAPPAFAVDAGAARHSFGLAGSRPTRLARCK